jgi:NRPS condensation-like uncharacterized protein
MIITAEMWDKMQHIMARYNDHMIHVYAKFDAELDTEYLKKAFELAVEKIPVLKSRFIWGLTEPKWEVIPDFSIRDIFSYLEIHTDPACYAEEKLLSVIDETKGAQIRIWQIRHEGADTLAILINHMCMDGADTKVFLYYVAGIYNDLVKGGDGIMPFKNGSRSAMQIYKSLSPEDYEKAMKLISYSKKQKNRIAFPYARSARRDRYPRINKYILDAGTFNKLKSECKVKGVSLNDVILACFFRAAYRIIDIKPGESLGIPNMVDLRRYMANGESEGICNLTSMVVSNLGEDIGKDIHETVAKTKQSMDELKRNFPGLHGLPLLKKVLDIIPYPLAWFLIGTFFKNPLIGISNIGILDEKKFAFDGAAMTEAYMTGSVKYPPYMQLALSTFRNTITHTIAVYGTDADHEMFRKFFDYYQEELRAFIG